MPDALASLPPGANVLVLDACSSDDTVAVARRAGATVLERQWTNFVDARTFAVDNVRSPWTFMLDADEQLDDKLREALFNIEPEAAEIEGYRVRRATRFCGEIVHAFGWDNEMILRMFRTDRGVVAAHPVAGGSAALHERWSVPGNVADLDGALFHNSYPEESTYAQKYERYTSIEAAGTAPSIARLVVSALVAPARFVWLLGPRGGLRLGRRGLYIAFWSASYQTIVRWKALRRKE
ncbi:MAG TPA: glycosyltransferase [Candidatus Baltobacteraceae bacterium]